MERTFLKQLEVSEYNSIWSRTKKSFGGCRGKLHLNVKKRIHFVLDDELSFLKVFVLHNVIRFYSSAINRSFCYVFLHAWYLDLVCSETEEGRSKRRNVSGSWSTEQQSRGVCVYWFESVTEPEPTIQINIMFLGSSLE